MDNIDNSIYIKPLRQNIIWIIIKITTILALIVVIFIVVLSISLFATVASYGFLFFLVIILLIIIISLIILQIFGMIFAPIAFANYITSLSPKEKEYIGYKRMIYFGFKAFLLSWEYLFRILYEKIF